MKERICEICNTMFIPASSRQKYCGKEVTRKCAVCGSDYLSKCTKDYSKCCSKECCKIFAVNQRLNSYPPKTCTICGSLFIPASNTQKYCKSIHVAKCEICGNDFILDLSKQHIRKTCSDRCAIELRFRDGNPFADSECRKKAEETCKQKYGVAHPAQSSEIRDKMKSTMLDKYGVEYYAQSPEYKEKSKATNIKRYGTEWASQNEDIKSKKIATIRSRYGTDNVMQCSDIKSAFRLNYLNKTGYSSPLNNPEVRNKCEDTIMSRYGVRFASQDEGVKSKIKETMTKRYGAPYVLQSKSLANKIRVTNLKKYGYANPAQCLEVREKIANTCTKKYGVNHYSKSLSYVESTITDPSKAEIWYQFKQDPCKWIDSKLDHKPTYTELTEMLGVSNTTIQHVLWERNQLDAVKYTLSSAEDEVVNFLVSVKPDINIIRHDRQIIKPKELDIVLPDYCIAIEVNPTSTHNSTLGHIYDEPKSLNYHAVKTEQAESNGYFIFHIYGYEWTHNKEVIKSMLRNLLHCNDTKIYARKCIIKDVSSNDAKMFLEANHRQGNTFAKVRLGLYYDNELVSLMTFNNIRQSAGTGKEDLRNCIELSRFCNKLNTSVIGGASKLFKYYLDTYSPDKIRSFSDRSHTRGTLYSTLGFKEVRKSGPSYVWVNYKTDKAVNRMNTQKRNLKRFLKDGNIDLSRTEREIMEEHGYVQVFDSGTITWEWSRS